MQLHWPKKFGEGNRSRRGIAVLMTAGMMSVIIPVVGLAIDASVLYAVKTRLSAAADAGALAGARSLNRGLDLASQRSSAIATAQAYFTANFPTGYLMTTNPTFTTTVDETQLKLRTVNMQATVSAPLFFMRFFGGTSTPVQAVGTAARRDVNVVLVLDRSTSLTWSGSCGAMQAASIAFVNKFAEGRDRVGLVSFGGSYRVDFPPAYNFQTASPNVTSIINSIVCNGYTGPAQALWQAYQRLVTINEPGALNVLLFFTDGNPTAFTAQLPVKTRTTSYSPTGKSTCLDEAGRNNTNAAWNPLPKLGWISTYSGFIQGVTDKDAGAPPVVSEPPISNRTGCYFAASPYVVVNDLAYIPETDYYGNSLSGYQPVSRYPSGPYIGKIRVDTAATILNASINSLDNAALRIRGDASLKPVIYCIGLGDAADPAPDDLLRRVANDPSSLIYDTSKPPGLYVYAPTAADLNNAFVRIASDILRLSQ